MSGRTRAEHSAHEGPLAPLAVAAGCAVAIALIWVLAELVPAIHYRDAALLHDFTRLSREPVESIASTLIHLLEPSLFVLWGIALVAIALARERPRTAMAAAAVMALSAPTSETLKPLLAHSHASVGGTYIGPASLPSGHSTAALALVLAAVFVAPPRVRALVAVAGALFAAAVGVSLLILSWHMPSDVLAGFFVASFWGAIALATVRAAERRWPSAHGGGL